MNTDINIRFYVNFLLVIVFLFFTQILKAENPYPDWEIFTNGDYIYCIEETNDFIWIGTSGGLVKIDKSDYSADFFHKCNSGLPGNAVQGLFYDDNNGVLWIGTRENGLIKYDGSAWVSYNTQNSGIQSNNIMDIEADNEGDIWAATYENGISIFDGTNWSNYNTTNSGLTNNFINCIEIVDNNTVWIGTNGGGLNIYDDGVWEEYSSDDLMSGFPADYVYAIDFNSNGKPWVATNNGLTRWDSFNGFIILWKTYNTTNSNIAFNVLTDVKINGSYAWLAAYGGGLIGFDNTTWTNYNTSNSGIQSDIIYKILPDNSNNVWVGSMGNGLSVYNSSAWEIVNTSSSGVPSNAIASIVFDNENYAWLGTLGGVGKYKNDDWENFNSGNSVLADNTVYSLDIDSKNIKWIATYSGMVKIEGSEQKLYNTSNSGLSNNNINIINIDNEDKVWIGTNGSGVCTYNNAQFESFNTGNSQLQSNFISSIVSDNSGNTWIGSFGGGLAKYDGNNWSVYRSNSSGLPDDSVRSLFIDKKDNLWIGTYGSGLAKFDGEAFEVFNKINSGLPGNVILSINEDKYGRLLVGTEGNGFAVYDYTDWDVYNRSNSGLPQSDVNCIAPGSDGIIWIGTSGGMTKFSLNYDDIVLPAPDLIFPDDNSSENETEIEFKWEEVKIASFYKIEISTDSEFDNLVYSSENVEDTFFNHSGFEENSSYYWHVAAGNNDGFGDWSDTWSFTTQEEEIVLSAPILIYPAENAVDTELGFTFTWKEVAEATKYKIEIAKKSNFQSDDIIQSDTALTLEEVDSENLEENTSYYWHVAAGNDNGYGSWSDTWKFTTLSSGSGKLLGITFPNGGEKFISDSGIDVRWQENDIENVDVLFSADNGENWITLETNVAADGLYYSWTIPYINSKNCLIMLADNDGFSDISDDVFEIFTPDSIEICDQIWMTKNLDVSTYRNGDAIPQVTNAAEWDTLTSGAWCYYNNDPANGEIYGKLYNWYAVNDPRGLAPDGWKVPTDDEWKEMEKCLGLSQADVDNNGWRGSDEGGVLKIKIGNFWESPNTNATNTTGFTALPGGYRSNDGGGCDYIARGAYFWTSSLYDDGNPWRRNLAHDNGGIDRSSTSKNMGLSVRCFKGESIEKYINITEPESGDSLLQGTTKNLVWESSDNIDSVKIEYSSNNGSSWEISEESHVNEGWFQWNVPEDTSNQYLVKITDIDDNSVFDISDNFSVIPLPDFRISIEKPGSGSVINAGSEYEITWTSENVENVKIEFTSDYEGNSWDSLTVVAANAGTYKWEVPDIESDKCKIKISDSDDDGVYDETEAFTIKQESGDTSKVILMLPENNASDQPVDVHFVWEEYDGAVRYEIAISEEESFTSIIDNNDNLNDKKYQSDRLEKMRTYYWRVTAVLSDNSEIKSDTWSFSTELPDNSITLSLPVLEEDTRAYQDKTLALKVTVDAAAFEENYLPDSLYLTVKFKKNFLYPLVDFRDEDGWRYVTLEKEISSITKGDGIVSFEAKVLLADTVYTPLIIDKYTWTGQYSDVNTTLTDGSLTLVNLGVDNAGNLRLIKPVEKAVIQNIRPNPADDKVILTIESTEDIDAALEIYSSVGNILETKKIKLNKGSNEITVPIGTELTNGIYSVLLRYNNGVDLRNLLIVR